MTTSEYWKTEAQGVIFEAWSRGTPEASFLKSVKHRGQPLTVCCPPQLPAITAKVGSS